MEISEAIIQKFFDRTGTPEEAEAVAAWFYSDAQLLENYFVEEWTEEVVTPLTTEESQELWGYIDRKIQRRRTPVRWLKAAAAVAASVLLVIGMTWLYRMHEAAAGIAQTEAPAADKWMLKRNSTDKAMTILLEDSTAVRMQPQA